MSYIIAEVGVNHNGSLRIAKKMAILARIAGADAVKFQTYQTDLLTRKTDPKYKMLKSLELPGFSTLSKICYREGIDFLSTAFDEESLDMLLGLGMRKIKVPSGEITNYPLLEYIATKGKPILLSTGMSSIEEIEAALKILGEVTLLHCTSSYPAPLKDVNLKAMVALMKYGDVGLSDHSLSIAVPAAAVVLGAKVIEKHFTLDKNDVGPDHRASLNYVEFKRMVEMIREAEEALGSADKKVAPSERMNRIASRRSLVAAKTIRKGRLFTKGNVTLKRPGDGMPPMFYKELIGKIATRNYEEDENIDEVISDDR